MNVSHRGKMWIDLTPVGGTPVFCKAQIEIGDHGEIGEFQAEIPDVPAEQINRIFNDGGLNWDEATSGELEDGRQFDGQIGSIISYEPSASGGMFVRGTMSRLNLAGLSEKTPGQWVFKLSNVKLWRGDVWSSYPEEKRQTLDSIEFTADGRNWRLTDTWSHKWKDTAKADLGKPILSGVLQTTFRDGDSEVGLTEAAQDICDVLAVAMSRSVNWLSYSLQAADGSGIRGYSRSTWVTAFNKHGFAPVSNHEPGSLKALLEGALPVIAADREWFSKTLGMLTQAQIADMIDIRCSILYTLADRISSRLVKSKGTAQIDPKLKPRARNPEFVEQLHGVLQQLSPENWTQELTASVLTEIKRWNSMPSFVAKIQRACSQQCLPEPDKTLLRPRNDLLHDGELSPGDGDDNVTHYFELDWLLLAMVLRLLGYEGVYSHPKWNDLVHLRDQLVTSGETVTNGP